MIVAVTNDVLHEPLAVEGGDRPAGARSTTAPPSRAATTWPSDRACAAATACPGGGANTVAALAAKSLRSKPSSGPVAASTPPRPWTCRRRSAGRRR
jgi:hypothetical protein